MIRSVRIPTSVNRLAAALIASPGCLSYQDPTTGLWQAMPAQDANGNAIASLCSPGDGSSAGSPLPFGMPGDPGLQDALDQFAASTNAAANQQALNAAQNPASLVLANSLMSGNIPSPLPGLGLTFPASLPASLGKYLLYGALALAAVIVFGESGQGSRR